MASAYFANYTIFITDKDKCNQFQGQFPNGVKVSPFSASTTYNAPLDPGAPTQGEGQCIWTYGLGNGTSGLTTATPSVVIPAGQVIDSFNNLVALAGAPGGTLTWVGYFLFRPNGSTNPTKEALQSHRWLVGFERPINGEGQSSGNPSQRCSRDASRTLDGLGLAMRSPANEFVTMTMPTTGTGYPAKASWERFYVRLRKYPTANEVIWGTKGSIEAGTAALLLASPSGQLLINNKGNQAFPGTNVLTGGQIPLNQWTRIDLIYTYGRNAGGGSADGAISLTVNNNFVGRAGGNGAGGSLVGGAGGLLNVNQNHLSSYIGNENTPTNGIEIDYDDWSCKTTPLLLTGDDWNYGSHIMPLRLEGFGTGNDASWVGDFRTLDAIPVAGQQDSVDSSTASVKMVVNTDFKDRQIGCSGFQVSLYNKTASSTTESLGYSINGAAAVLTNVTTATGAWAAPSASTFPAVIYTAGGNLNCPTLTQLAAVYTRDGVANLRQVQELNITAEYLGIFGTTCDPSPASSSGSGAQTQAPFPQPAHNSPYYDSSFGSNAFGAGDGIVESMAGTYTGNGTGQDISLQFPAHWIWIRPLTGGTGGARWWSSMQAGHDPMLETPNKGNLVRCYQQSYNGGTTSYNFRISGSNANSNANGVVYQWVAFSDTWMRFVLNNAYLTNNGNASFVHNLYLSGFTPVGGFLLPEISTVSATTGMYFKGPGEATNNACLMDTGDTASICAFNTGSITPQATINLAAAQTAYSLWRTTDDAGVSGPVAITSYTGDGTGSRNITLALNGRAPLLAIVAPHNGVAYVRDPSHTGSNSTPINSATASTTAITGGAVNQITVNSTLNANAVVYEVFVIAGTTSAFTNPASPIPLADPTVPPSTFPTSSLNGWWVSSNSFTGAATLSTFPPTNPRDARDWEKINIFATGNSGFYAGFPPPGAVVNNFFYYAGNDYQIGGTQPTIRIFDGVSDRSIISIPDVAGVKAIAIISMLAVGSTIYLTTLDSGTSNSTWAGRVLSLDTNALALSQIGAQFTGGEVPYALAWHMGRLFMGTNKGDGSVAKVYFFRPGLDSAWTTDYTITTSGFGGALSMASFLGKLYVGCNATAAMGTNGIIVRDTAGAYTTTFTATVGGTFRSSNGFPSMTVFNNKLYASYWNPDTTPDCYLMQYDGTTWTKVYSGSGNTLKPFSGLFTSKGTIFIIGGGSALTACLVSSQDGNTWTNLTPFLTGSTSQVTAMPIVGQIGT